MIKIALFIISISNIFSQTPDERGYIVKVGDKLPEFIMDFPDGSQLNSQDLKGKVTMIQFTASWCHVCREEMPHIEKEIWKVYKKVDLNVVGIDRDESAEVIKRFAKEVKVTYPIALDIGADIFALFADRNSGITRNIIVDPNGKIAFLTRLFDPEEFYEMKNIIHSLLVNQLLEEKQILAAQKQILKELKNKSSIDKSSSINKIEKSVLSLERKLNLKERRLSFAQKLL